MNRIKIQGGGFDVYVYWVVIALLTKGQKLLEQRINKFMGVK